jgi:Mrp family chromosome partitioning ATPase
MFEAEMRTLRSQLQGLLEERKPLLLSVSACNSGEGASTIAQELARSLSLDGFEVLFCGSSDGVGVEPTPSRAERRVIRTLIPALSFLDISDLHRPGGKLKTLVALRDWLETAKGAYDVVVVDTPPILNQGGWETMLRTQDGMILVMEAERTRAQVLKATIAAVEAAGGHILGIVFNRRRQHIPAQFYQWL